MSEKWTATHVPDQRGRLAVVTGANTGLGFETAKVLATRGASVVLAVRDLDKGKQAAKRIAEVARSADIMVQRLDLASLASVRAAAREIGNEHRKIDLLINNAGVMFTPNQSTEDCFEMHFGTNHLGHFAFTGLLLDRLLKAPGSRVVTLTSLAYKMGATINFDDLQWQRSYDRAYAYGQSKLANLLFTYELNRRLSAAKSHAIAVAAHPGNAATELFRNSTSYLGPLKFVSTRVFNRAPEAGALPTLRAATDPTVAGGDFFGPDGFLGLRGDPTLLAPARHSRDTALLRRLWMVSEELTGVVFPV